VKAGPARDDIYYQIIDRSEHRRTFSYAAWCRTGGKLYPYVALETSTVEETLSAVAEASEVPEAAWIELAALFLDKLKDLEKFVYDEDAE
jgi:hypothetical protein